MSEWTEMQASDGQWLSVDPWLLSVWKEKGSPSLTGAQWLDLPREKGGAVFFRPAPGVAHPDEHHLNPKAT